MMQFLKPENYAEYLENAPDFGAPKYKTFFLKKGSTIYRADKSGAHVTTSNKPLYLGNKTSVAHYGRGTNPFSSYTASKDLRLIEWSMENLTKMVRDSTATKSLREILIRYYMSTKDLTTEIRQQIKNSTGLEISTEIPKIRYIQPNNIDFLRMIIARGNVRLQNVQNPPIGSLTPTVSRYVANELCNSFPDIDGWVILPWVEGEPLFEYSIIQKKFSISMPEVMLCRGSTHAPGKINTRSRSSYRKSTRRRSLRK